MCHRYQIWMQCTLLIECRNFDGRILHVMTLSRDGSCKIAQWREKSGTQFKGFYRDKLIRINKRSRANTDGISSPFVFLPIQLCTIHFPAVLLNLDRRLKLGSTRKKTKNKKTVEETNHVARNQLFVFLPKPFMAFFNASASSAALKFSAGFKVPWYST